MDLAYLLDPDHPYRAQGATYERLIQRMGTDFYYLGYTMLDAPSDICVRIINNFVNNSFASQKPTWITGTYYDRNIYFGPRLNVDDIAVLYYPNYSVSAIANFCKIIEDSGRRSIITFSWLDKRF